MNKREADTHRRVDRLLFVLALIVFVILLPLKGAFPKKGGVDHEVLTFAQWWRGELEEEALESIIREFEGLHPGIRIQLINLSYREIRDRLTALETSGEEGFLAKTDIIGLDPLWLEDLIRAEQLAPLGGSTGTPDSAAADQTRAAPLLSFMNLFFYNIDVLKNAGFNRPPKTQGEFLEAARALAAQGRFGLGLALSPDNPIGIYQDLFPWFWASGAALIREGKPTVTGKTVTGVLEFLKGLHREGLISPDSFSKTVEQKREEFAAGKIGMMAGSIRDIALLRERMGDGGFGISSFPGPDLFTGKAALGLSAWYVGVSARSEHPEEARAFVSFLMEKAPVLAAAARAVPGQGNGPGSYITADPLYSKAWDLYEGGETIREFDGVPRFRDLEALFRLEFIGLFEGGQSPAETAPAIQRDWERLLNN